VEIQTGKGSEWCALKEEEPNFLRIAGAPRNTIPTTPPPGICRKDLGGFPVVRRPLKCVRRGVEDSLEGEAKGMKSKEMA